jgi:DNA-binding transcriptional MerR regulator
VSNPEQRTWRVGDLADSTGLTVRTLHHYDEIGLLRPSGRDSAGYRRYDAADLRRLHQIVALRGFGLSLAEIGDLLDGSVADPRDLLRDQLDQLAARIRAAERARWTLLRVLAALDDRVEPDTQALIDVIGVTNAMDQPLTPAQVRQMQADRAAKLAAMTPEEIARLNAHRQQTAARLTPEELAEMNARRRALMPD